MGDSAADVDAQKVELAGNLDFQQAFNICSQINAGEDLVDGPFQVGHCLRYRRPS